MNNKKHTFLKRKLSILVIISSVFYIFGCAPKQLPPAIIPPAPKQTQSVLPTVKKAGVEVDSTIDNNSKIGNKIDESKKTVLDQKISIEESLIQAEKIKEKAIAKLMVTELEALNLIEALNKVKTRNLFLEKQNEELSLLKKDQEKILNIIKNTLKQTEDLIYEKEQEARLLREQNRYLSKGLIDKNNESETLKKLLAKEKEVSASAKVYRNAIWGLVAIWVALLILKNVWMSINPAARLRF